MSVSHATAPDGICWLSTPGLGKRESGARVCGIIRKAVAFRASIIGSCRRGKGFLAGYVRSGASTCGSSTL